MADVVLTVDGTAYSGWREIDIRRGIEQVAGTFRLSVTDRWAGREQAWPIKPGADCTVVVDGFTAISGYVDDVLPFFDVRNHGVSVVGRDKSGDLVDCSAIVSGGQWRGRNLLQVATDIATPFGVSVRAVTDVGATFRDAALQEGETAWEAIERAARMRGVLVYADAAGGLIIARAGSDRAGTALVQGKNVLAARGTFSFRDRYQQYICKGQNGGFDTATPEQNAGPSGRAADTNVRRYRPLIIVAEDVSDSAGLENRALWEAAVRMGRASRPVVTVQGWSHEGGLWEPNTIVRVECPYLYIEREMLIVSVGYRLDERGSRTDIELCAPEAFDLLPVPESDIEPW